MSNNNDSDKCPVDHKAREAWMKKQQPTASLNGGESECPVDHNNSQNCSSDRDTPINTRNAFLSTERETSSIPRASTPGKNWVYPSQQQFFDAMKRKNFDPDAKDMQTVIPIHNAVNERAWMEIMKWEEGQGSEKCGGCQLIKFEGDSTKLTPTARFNMLMGREKPFDRHDWSVDRCGKQVDYVIDFYSGKPNPMVPEMPSFYLDARPKLNSMEGIRLRLTSLFK